MKKIIKFPILSFIIEFSFILSSYAIETQRVNPTLTWEDARAQCREMGSSWDLPKVSDVTLSKISTDIFDKVSVRDLKTQKISYYNLIWIRSDEEALNSQLIEVSQALKFEPKSGMIDSYVMSAKENAARKNYVSLLLESRNLIARTANDQTKVESFLEQYRKSDFGSVYPIDEDYPIEMQPGFIAMLPQHIMPLEIRTLLEKPSQRFVDTEIENMQFQLDVVADGLDVICVK